MGASKRADTTLDRLGIAVHRVGVSQAHDRLGHRQHVTGAMVDLAREQDLVLLRLLAVGDVHGDPAQASEPAGSVATASGNTDAPPDLAVRTADAELGADRLLLFGDRGNRDRKSTR